MTKSYIITTFTMNIIYRTKGKTQGHLRKIMTEDYKNNWNSVLVWKKYEISHTTILKWSKSETLENGSSSPKIPARKYELSSLCLIYWLYEKENMKWDEILDYFEDNNLEMKRSSIYYYLNNWGLTKRKKESKKRINQQFKDYEPWFLHVDITYWPKLNWIKYYIFVSIDRATRLIYLEIHDNKKASTASNFLEKAIDFFPFKINKVLTDNGKEFTLNNHKWNDSTDLVWAFDVVCNKFVIDHRTTRPYTPQTNWMVEKSNDTIKSNTIKINTYENLKEMTNDLLCFMVFYNLNRRHSSLRKELWVKTPYDALMYWYEKDSSIFKEDLFDFKEKLLNIKKSL